MVSTSELAQTTKDYGLLRDVDEIKTYVGGVMRRGQPFGFDIESGYDGEDTDDLAKWAFHPRWKIVGFSFTDSLEWARYIPLGHDDEENADPLVVARVLWKLLNTGNGVAHNSMFELQGLARFFRDQLWNDEILGAEVRASNGYYPVLSDTLIEAFMSNKFEPREMGRGVGNGLKAITKEEFGHEQMELVELIRSHGIKLPKIKALRFNPLPLDDETIAYACEDALWCLAHHFVNYPPIKDSLVFRTEMALQPVLCQMEYEGIVLDWKKFEDVEAILADFKDRMNEDIQEEFSRRLNRLMSINFGSPKQVAAVLYAEEPEGLGLPVKYRSDKTGAPSTSEKALRALAKQDKTIKRILEWRELGALLSRYITKYLKELHYDERGHPNHKQTGTNTGRFSVDHVSYQQWPKPYDYTLDNGDTFKLNYREFLLAPEDSRIIGFDFSQVELRVLAGVSNETVMLDAFRNGIDIHRATAAAMFNIPLEDVTKDLRAKGKTGNFAVVYQSGAGNMAELMGTTRKEATEMLQAYYDGFPNLRSWMDAQIREGQQTGYVTNIFGRRFRIWEYEDARKKMAMAAREKDPTKAEKLKKLAEYISSKGDRMCINAPIQGGAADYMKVGMVRVSKAIKRAEEEGIIPVGGIRLVMTIHDALEFYVHKDVATQTVIDLINPAVSYEVPGLPEIRADWHEGRTWGSVVEIETDADKQITGYSFEDESGNKHHFDNIDDAYYRYDNPLTPEEAPAVKEAPPMFEEEEFDPDSIDWEEELPSQEDLPKVVIELGGLPDAEQWASVKDYLSLHDWEAGREVWVKVQGASKQLPHHIKGTSTQLEDLRFLIPASNIQLTHSI